jgi:hypothetical protein
MARRGGEWLGEVRRGGEWLGEVMMKSRFDFDFDSDLAGIIVLDLILLGFVLAGGLVF